MTFPAKRELLNMIAFLKNNVALLLGVTLFLIGCIGPANYEKAKENGYEVDAKIVEVKKEIEDDLDGGYTSTSYTVYADYEVNGEVYTHIKIGKYYDTDEYYVGKTVKVVVNPNSPGKPLFEGGVLCVVGFLIALFAGIAKIKARKSSN